MANGYEMAKMGTSAASETPATMRCTREGEDEDIGVDGGGETGGGGDFGGTPLMRTMQRIKRYGGAVWVSRKYRALEMSHTNGGRR